jgi:hypothetical protein
VFFQEVNVDVNRLSTAFLLLAIATGVIYVTLGVAARYFGRGGESRDTNPMEAFYGIIALGLLFMLFLKRTDSLSNYVTVFWGVSGIAIFLAGLFGRSKPLRLTGLIGLLLCVPRMFMVDIRSTLYRIAAFIALGIALLVVGYLYTRFRERIARWDNPVEPGVSVVDEARSPGDNG